MTNNPTNPPRSRLGRLGPRLLDLLPEALWLGGAVLLYRGLHAVYPPAADIGLGALFLFAGWRLAAFAAAAARHRKGPQ